jgi:integrase
MLHRPRTKNEEPPQIPLNGTAPAALRAIPARGAVDGRVFLSERTGLPLDYPRHWFDPALEEAKITGFHWHDLRDTLVSPLRKKITPLEDIADLLEHKRLTVTRRDAHVGPSRLHEVLARHAEKPVKTGTKSGTVDRRSAIHSVVSYLN